MLLVFGSFLVENVQDIMNNSFLKMAPVGLIQKNK